MNGKSVALGLPVFTRTEAIQKSLNSVEGNLIDRVIIADNGNTQKRNHLYNRNWDFEITVLDIEYDSGIGNCRAAIAEELKEDFLIVADNDMIIPPESDLKTLQKVLNVDTNIGGVSGIIIEESRIRSGCSNFHEVKSVLGKKYLIHSIRTEPTIEWLDETIPIAKFDKLTNAAMIRRECVEDVNWDKRFPTMEHLDFYLGHYHETDWEFAVTPKVIFDHQKGKYPSYRKEIRNDVAENFVDKKTRAENLYREKWGYEKIEYGSRPDWIDTKEKTILEKIYRYLHNHTQPKFLVPIKNAVQQIL